MPYILDNPGKNIVGSHVVRDLPDGLLGVPDATLAERATLRSVSILPAQERGTSSTNAAANLVRPDALELLHGGRTALGQSL